MRHALGGLRQSACNIRVSINETLALHFVPLRVERNYLYIVCEGVPRTIGTTAAIPELEHELNNRVAVSPAPSLVSAPTKAIEIFFNGLTKNPL